jgi:hypothetical protein
METYDSQVHSTDAFEELLNRRQGGRQQAGQASAPKRVKRDTDYSRAEKGASMADFFELVKQMVIKALKKEKVEIVPNDGPRRVLDPAEKIDHPLIYYKVVSRVPRDKNYKPRFREDIYDRNPDGSEVRQGAIYGQFFDCEIQFDIIASDYSTADRVMNAFEDAMQKYAGFFKRNGVSEVLFAKQFTDENLDIYRQKMSVRSLVYDVAIERIRLAYDTTITEITQS